MKKNSRKSQMLTKFYQMKSLVRNLILSMRVPCIIILRIKTTTINTLIPEITIELQEQVGILVHQIIKQ